jgi:hypothetical protein
MTDDAPKEELDGEEANEVARRYGEYQDLEVLRLSH